MKRFCLLGAVLCGADMAQAASITVVEQTTGSGFLDGTVFTDKLITITLVGDTNNLVTGPGFFGIVGIGTVVVAGVGSDTLTDTISAYSDPPFLNAGIEDSSGGGSSVVLATDSASFTAYGLDTSFGPIVGGAFIASGENFPTGGGNFGITSITSIGGNQNSTFTATVGAASTPEPGTWVLMAAGIAGIGLKLRRRAV